jgi:microcompartment protein CcmL/EutN
VGFIPRSKKKKERTMTKAIALLEVQAMVAAIAGLDAMVKAADVHLIHVEKRLGGRLVTVVVQGEVSAVQAAAAAGAAAAAEVGNVKLCEVIARPHPDVMKFLTTG